MAFVVRKRHRPWELNLIVQLCTLCVVYCSSYYDHVTRISLNDSWLIWNPNRPSVNATGNIPFTVHSRLFAAGFLQDPYYRFNDLKYRWVSTDNWVFSKSFVVTDELLKHSRINLVFNSIDTVANVYLNGLKVGSSQDKFLKYEFDVTNFVAHGMNKVELYMVSPIAYSLSQSKRYVEKYKYPVLPNCYPKVLHGECHSNFIRKEPCSFGWDLGPSFPTQGLFDLAYVEGVTLLALGRTMVRTVKELGKWTVHVCSDIIGFVSNVQILIDFEILENGMSETKHTILLEGISMSMSTSIQIKSDIFVKEWWPHQYGNQDLYTLQVTVYDTLGHKIQSKATKFGFRTVELIQQPIPGSEGLSFFFKINGIEIFLKGSNWVPPDALRDRVTNDMIKLYLSSAIAANINVLRVWGGGGYESDYFYEQCDQLGLLIWQDFMFACAMYPTNPEYLDLVKNETIYQLKRLHNHPSIIVWSGNNENEVALRENWYGTQSDFFRYKMDYVTLYVKNLREIVENFDKTRPFVVSSPSNGIESMEEGWVAKDPRNPLYGDVHHYNYTANCWNPDLFPKPRFASEYGYQSYPSLESLKKVSLLSDLEWNSTLMFYRQHHQDGNKQIEDMIRQNFGLPRLLNASIYFEHMLYLSQIVQSICVTFETENYRRLRGRLVSKNNDGTDSSSVFESRIGHKYQYISSKESHSNNINSMNVTHDASSRFESALGNVSDLQFTDTIERMFGHTMGAMYWQLNDIWQAPAWGSIEYGGKWKMLHYYAKNFFRDIALSYYTNGDLLDVFIVSDLLTEVYGTLSVAAYKWSSLASTKEGSYSIDIPSQVATLSKTISISDWCLDVTECFLILSLEVFNMANYSYSRPVFLAPFSVVRSLKDPEVNMSNFVQVSPRVVAFSVVIQYPAAFLWFDTATPGHFSDNGFIQFHASKTLFFYAAEDVTAVDLSQSLHCVSLYNTIHKE